jgi:hypothetical protein
MSVAPLGAAMRDNPSSVQCRHVAYAAQRVGGDLQARRPGSGAGLTEERTLRLAWASRERVSS